MLGIVFSWTEMLFQSWFRCIGKLGRCLKFSDIFTVYNRINLLSEHEVREVEGISYDGNTEKCSEFFEEMGLVETTSEVPFWISTIFMSSVHIDFLKYLIAVYRFQYSLSQIFDLSEGIRIISSLDIIFDRETRVGFDVFLLFSRNSVLSSFIRVWRSFQCSQSFSISIW